MNDKICCFTGHRPEKLNMSEKDVKGLLKDAIKTTIEDGFLTFITGMARGVDMRAAEIVLNQKKTIRILNLFALRLTRDLSAGGIYRNKTYITT